MTSHSSSSLQHATKHHRNASMCWALTLKILSVSIKRHKTGRHHHQASFIRGGGVIWTRHTHPTLDPPRPTQTPPPLIILWGAFFVNQIEAKALSRFRHPQRVTHQKLHNTRV